MAGELACLLRVPYILMLSKTRDPLHAQKPCYAIYCTNLPHVVQVGYMAERVTATPASRHKPVVHRCEVLAMPDGSGPVFR